MKKKRTYTQLHILRAAPGAKFDPQNPLAYLQAAFEAGAAKDGDELDSKPIGKKKRPKTARTASASRKRSSH
ncbi:MAG TPA: hypothetical protein VG269_09965 [Tepidisphaeraceae bacterium]|jgi:hypothetical protein|nr:hypothetical protein [Tepidisphaeraceae bacterium]